MFDITHEGRTTLNIDRAGAEGLGYPAAAIEAAIAAARKGEVSAECRRRIYAHADAEMQMNMAVTAAGIASKAASSRSDEEKAALAGVGAARDWVDAMRAAYRDMPADADYLADDAWPEMPGDVAIVVSQF